jgi:hypothetical protein
MIGSSSEDKCSGKPDYLFPIVQSQSQLASQLHLNRLRNESATSASSILAEENFHSSKTSHHLTSFSSGSSSSSSSSASASSSSSSSSFSAKDSSCSFSKSSWEYHGRNECDSSLDDRLNQRKPATNSTSYEAGSGSGNSSVSGATTINSTGVLLQQAEERCEEDDDDEFWNAFSLTQHSIEKIEGKREGIERGGAKKEDSFPTKQKDCVSESSYMHFDGEEEDDAFLAELDLDALLSETCNASDRGGHCESSSYLESGSDLHRLGSGCEVVPVCSLKEGVQGEGEREGDADVFEELEAIFEL